jgi:hypothetical protein
MLTDLVTRAVGRSLVRYQEVGEEGIMKESDTLAPAQRRDISFEFNLAV